MKLEAIHEGLHDGLRRRILHLLRDGELCVCHFQEILGAPQVQISKHLAYLRARGLVAARRQANWMIYRLPDRPPPELTAHLDCLVTCVRGDPIFRADRTRGRRLRNQPAISGPRCCAPQVPKGAPTRRSHP
jgi:ArsR family transcriptional regulator